MTTESSERNGADNRDSGRLSESLNELKNQAANLISAITEDLRGRSGRLSGDAQRQARAAYETVNRQVHERPAAALGVAAALGLMLGWMLARRR